jgi:DNA-binding LytR/AlgR family response regulator
MIIAIALDDEPPALQVIKAFCAKEDEITLVKTFSSASEAGNYLQKFPVDLLFLDINMPSISGLEFCRTIASDTMVIFTTAYSEFAIEGFNLNAVDYLLKPFTRERFQMAVQKAIAYHRFLHQSQSEKKEFILLRVDYSMVKVVFADILFIEGLDDYIKIHSVGGGNLVVRMTLKALSEKLPAVDFMRVHRSYIVPFAKIESVRNKMILISGEEIPIGNSYEDAFFSKFR